MISDPALVEVFKNLKRLANFEFRRRATEKSLQALVDAGYDLGATEALYAVHDGQTGPALLDDDAGPFRWMSLKESLLEANKWKALKSSGAFASRAGTAKRGIHAAWWHDAWLPIGENGTGDVLCLDCDPPGEGVPGQIVRVLHDDPLRIRAAKSLEELVRRVAKGLQSGELHVSDDYGGVVPAEELESVEDAPRGMAMYKGPSVVDSTMRDVALLTQTHYLNLTGARVTDRGLAQLGTLVNLRSIMLGKTLVTNEGVIWLLRTFPKLEDLELPPKANLDLVDALADHAGLKRLGVYGSRFAKRAQEALTKRKPGISYF